MPSSVDQQEQRPHERQQEGQGRFAESERGGLSRASFVQAAGGSAAALLALSMVSYTTCTCVFGSPQQQQTRRDEVVLAGKLNPGLG